MNTYNRRENPSPSSQSFAINVQIERRKKERKSSSLKEREREKEKSKRNLAKLLDSYPTFVHANIYNMKSSRPLEKEFSSCFIPLETSVGTGWSAIARIVT